MALTQMQIIQSLGEAMSWFEKELQWGVPPTELRHLSGRIGELYAALMTNGQLATEVNQEGYDVVSQTGERISVKTTAIMGTSGHISFNPNTLSKVDRVMVLRINTEEMQIETLLNDSIRKTKILMSASTRGGRHNIPLSKMISKDKTRKNLAVIKEANWPPYTITELENGSIEVREGKMIITPSKPILRECAYHFKIGLYNDNGNLLNTRTLGNLIIKAVNDQGTK
jgi:hypothetical protein